MLSENSVLVQNSLDENLSGVTCLSYLLARKAILYFSAVLKSEI